MDCSHFSCRCFCMGPLFTVNRHGTTRGTRWASPLRIMIESKRCISFFKKLPCSICRATKELEQTNSAKFVVLCWGVAFDPTHFIVLLKYYVCNLISYFRATTSPINVSIICFWLRHDINTFSENKMKSWPQPNLSSFFTLSSIAKIPHLATRESSVFKAQMIITLSTDACYRHLKEQDRCAE